MKIYPPWKKRTHYCAWCDIEITPANEGEIFCCKKCENAYYSEQLTYKKIQVQESGDGYVIPGKCWYFKTWDLVKDYIDKLKEA